ncbi:Endonuclease MutS2, partial [Haemophilus influenzae]|jgi:hypothetical protein
MRKK